MSNKSNNGTQTDQMDSTDARTTSHSGTTWKVLGELDATGAVGVLGHNTATSGDGYGIEGVTDSTDAGTAGIKGTATASSGKTYGVYGETSSSSGYGVYAKGDARVEGDQTVTGSQSVETLGAQAELSSSQDIPDKETKTVAFNSVSVDQFGSAFDSSGVFTVPEDGTYRVDSQISWGDQLAGQTQYSISIRAGGRVVASATRGVPGDQQYDVQTVDRISRTVFGLTENETISIEVRQVSGEKKSLSSLGTATYVTIEKVG